MTRVIACPLRPLSTKPVGIVGISGTGWVVGFGFGVGGVGAWRLLGCPMGCPFVTNGPGLCIRFWGGCLDTRHAIELYLLTIH